MVNGTPFSVLLERAVQIKTMQSKSLRSTYEKYPRYFQNSLFPNEDVLQARKCSCFTDKFHIATKMKDEGNDAFRQQQYNEAMSKYEMAVSIFKYIENTNPSFQTEVS